MSIDPQMCFLLFLPRALSLCLFLPSGEGSSILLAFPREEGQPPEEGKMFEDFVVGNDALRQERRPGKKGGEKGVCKGDGMGARTI
jgi:hypothetical protein